MSSIWTIVVGAGSGSRFGGYKQLATIGSARVIDLTLKIATQVSAGVTLVLPDELCPMFSGCGASVVKGGATRSESVRLGFESIPATVDFVLVHDAARPLASFSLYQRVISRLLAGSTAVIPVVPIVDSLAHINEIGGLNSLSREGIVAVQTPQGFTRECLFAIVQAQLETTDEGSAAERLGAVVDSVEGDYSNMKITTKSDLMIARALLHELFSYEN